MPMNKSYCEKIFKEKLTPAIEEIFENHYLCNRVWEAWNVGTMSMSDFNPVSKDDDFFQEFLNHLYKKYKDGELLDEEDEYPTLELIEENLFSFFENQKGLEIWYNPDPENDFDRDSFHNYVEDMEGYDYQGIVDAFNKYIEFEKIIDVNTEEKTENKIKNNRKISF
jgi:hypothetical protein